MLGSYDPHAKTTTLVKEKAEFYLSHGAQPSDRVVRLFQSEGVALPAWVKKPSVKQRAVRHPEKLRSNQPKQVAETPVEATAGTDASVDAKTEA
jgi:ribosomal protein S16